MKLEVQMRRFIWNINTNPFPHLKTAYGREADGCGPESPSTDRLDRLTVPRDRGPNSSN